MFNALCSLDSSASVCLIGVIECCLATTLSRNSVADQDENSSEREFR